MAIMIQIPQDLYQQAIPSKTIQKNTKQINVQYVLENVDLVDLILDYGIDLIEQVGGDYISLCPFHDDKDTPSLRVYTPTNTWHCFGCNKGSSVFDFVMNFDDISFAEALQKLAEKVGYSGIYTLRSINLIEKNYKFSAIREKIELAIFKKYSYIYNEKRKEHLDKNEVFNIFENFWKWYDECQYLFNQKIDEGIHTDILERNFYVFYAKALNKLKTITRQ